MTWGLPEFLNSFIIRFCLVSVRFADTPSPAQNNPLGTDVDPDLEYFSPDISLRDPTHSNGLDFFFYFFDKSLLIGQFFTRIFNLIRSTYLLEIRQKLKDSSMFYRFDKFLRI